MKYKISSPIIILVLLCLTVNQIKAQCEDNWVITEGGAGFETFMDVAVDETGAAYTIGYYNSTTVINGQTILNPNGSTRIFLQKYNSDGSLAWSDAPEMTGIALNQGQTIHYGDNHIYLAFSFIGDVVYGSDVITDEDSNGGILLMKLDTDGNKVWHQILDSSSLSNYVTGINTDSEGNVYFGGRGGSMMLGSEAIGEDINSQAFVVKLDRDGEYLWHLINSSGLFSRVWPIEIDAEDNVIFGGYFVDSLQLGNGSIAGDSDFLSDLFVAKYNSEGEALWIQPGYSHGPGYGHSFSLEVTEDAVYVTGIMGDSLELDGEIYESEDGSSAFVGKYGLENGSVEWFKLLGANNSSAGEVGTGVFEKENGNIISVSELQINPYIDGTFYSGGEGQDIYLVEFTPDGTLVSSSNTNIPGVESSSASAIVGNDLYISGNVLASEGQFGCLPFTNFSSNQPGLATEDAFLWKVNVTESPERVVASFDQDLTTDPTVTLTDASTGNPECWEWSFLGSDSLIGSGENLTLTFDEPGSYIVSIKVSNCFSSADDFIPFIIDFQGVPLADFEYTVAEDGLTVSFVDASSNDPLSWIWVYGDGFEAVDQNPEHTFEDYGEYEVCLSAVNSVGISQASCQTIELINPNPNAASASFSYEGEDLAYTFENTSQNGDTYSWDFGDGTSSEEASPVYSFEAGGEYEVCLTVTNMDGDSDTDCQTISVVNTGINDLSLIQLNIAPQPMQAYTQLLFDNSEWGQLHLELYNTMGEKVAVNYEQNAQGIKVYRENIPTGQYFFSLSNRGEVLNTGKLMVF